MKKTIPYQDQVFWYLKRPETEVLRKSIRTEVVVIGGGMAGLSAAQAFLKKGKKVVLLEAYYCGAGATGKSSGFITPNGELGLSDFSSRYGKEGGYAIWKRIEAGMHNIRKNIEEYNLECDYTKADSLLVANAARHLKTLQAEHDELHELGYNSIFFNKEDMRNVVGSEGYYGGITYPENFGISAYKYCQEMKTVLIKEGAQIYEETPAIYVKDHTVETLHATVSADHIIVCADRFIPTFGTLTHQLYHAQNFILMSQPLAEEEIKMIFPNRQYMVWDTDLIYNYYRLSGNRLILGGGSLLSTYNKNETHNSNYMYHKLTRYFRKKFPQITIQFEQMWPGLIGISKDIAPILGTDNTMSSVYYIGGAAGLPVAAGLGIYSADHIIDQADDLKDYFSPYRSFPIGNFAQNILGTKLSFALSNVIKLNVP